MISFICPEAIYYRYPGNGQIALTLDVGFFCYSRNAADVSFVFNVAYGKQTDFIKTWKLYDRWCGKSLKTKNKDAVTAQ